VALFRTLEARASVIINSLFLLLKVAFSQSVSVFFQSSSIILFDCVFLAQSAN
jgi:hypothetical protein